MLAAVLVCFGAAAADKSGVSPNTISVPKGPGSIEGLGESFQPTLNTGTAKYGLGIKLPPGVAGHQPSLGLSYDGGGANGPLGYGWNLPMPSIQRRTDKGIPTYGEDLGVTRPDVFINDMKEELVPQADGYFFCKNEGAFIRYRRVADHWEATAPNGTRLEFGLTAAGRIEDAATSRVFAWLLERETDTRGNVIDYVYRSFPGAQNLNQKYLALVRYGPGAPPWTHFHFAAFAYEDRTDWFEDGRAGFLVRTGKRLESIFIGSQGATLNGHLAGDFDGDGTTDYLNRRYDLDYLQYAGTNSHWSLLEKVTLVGADGVTALPPATFAYAVSNPAAELSAQGHVWGAIDEPSVVMDNELVDLIDLNADGLPDLLRTESGGGVHTAYANRGPSSQPGVAAIQWGPPVAVDPGAGTAWNFDLASDQTHLADMDGDGLADLVHKSADESVFFFANRGKLKWGERQDMALQNAAPPAPFGVNDVRTADVDFDKRIDVIQSIDVGGGIAYRVWFNLGNQTYSAPVTVESLGGFAFTLTGVQIADCNGDRVPDLAHIQPGAVRVAAGLGYGRFAEPQSLGLPDATLDDLQIAKAKLTDINGDGLADLVLERAAPGACWYWLNLGNYTLSPRKRILDLPALLSANAATRWADLNGNGTTDLIYADSQATPRLRMVELGELVSGGLAPNLLTRIENSIGRVTRIEYAPSTRFALQDAAAGRPWPDALPFPVTVVAGVTVSDSLGHEYGRQFHYHDGYYDPEEKQFRGFARVEQIDVGDPTAPTLVSRSQFDTGRDFETMKGKLLRLITEQTDGKVFSDETTTWINPPRTLMVGTNGEAVRFVHPIASAREIFELGRGVSRRVENESEFDPFGNLARAINHGIVEGTNWAAFNDERITRTEYSLNTNAWILRLPKRQEVSDEHGVVISRSESFYDDETFSGTNFGAVMIGNLTLRRAWITPSNATAFVNAARTRYDAYGNPIALFDPLSDGTGSNTNQGHFRELTYDDRFHSYPVRETIHIGNGKPDLVFQAAYDEGLATATSSTDFNGNGTTYGYDTLGRLFHIVKPGDTTAYPTAEYDYALAIPAEYWSADGLVRSTGMVSYVETRLLDQAPATAGSKRDHYLITRQFVDGLGRGLMTKSEAEPAPGSTASRVAVNGAVQFNARQKPARALNSFFTTRNGSLEELLAFENIEAPNWQGQFHENGRMVTLNLGSAHASTTEYDATLRVIRATNSDGTSGRTDYEPLLVRSLDENDTDPSSPYSNTPTLHFSDGLGRLIRVDEVVRLNDDGTPAASLNTWATRYEYDLNDALVRIADSQDNVKLMQYDGLKRKTSMNDLDAGISTNAYDDASNLIETVDARGQRITYTYDGVNRILTEEYHDENSTEFSYGRTPDVAYFYDEPAASVDHGDGTRATAGNTKGLLAYVDDASGQEHTSFDARGRVEWTVKRIPDPQIVSLSASGGDGQGEVTLVSYTTRYEYDSLDRATRMIYPDNDQVTYEYNARGLLQRIAGGPTGSIISAVDYLPSAQPQKLDCGNGVRTTYSYDSRLRLSNLLTVSQPSTLNHQLIAFAYTFDAVSNIKGIEDQRPLSVVPASDPRRNTQVFAYDDLYRLTRVHYNPSTLNPQPATNFIACRYDRIGNVLAQTSDIPHFEKGLSVTDLGTIAYGGSAGRSGRLGRQPSDPPGPHALTSITQPSTNNPQLRQYPYDANGNMTDIDGLKCAWDFKDRLVLVEDETMRAEYIYDFTDRRIVKRVFSKTPDSGTQTPSTATYVGKHFEIREHDQPTKYVFNGSTRVARITGSLSANTRIQRIRLHPGWNLVSLAVTASDALQQMTNSQFSILNSQSIFRWNPPAWDPVVPDETLAAGTVLWIKSTTNTTLALTGAYNDPTNRPIGVGGAFLSSSGLEALPLLGEKAGVRADVALSIFTASTQLWQFVEPSIPLADPGFPEFLAPGEAMFIQADAPAELSVPDAALRIRYYHQDHLGSSSVMTDADGALVEEIAFHPFGTPRHEHRPRQIEENYQFTQKERDSESGLHYFEARYLGSRLSRFITPDPRFASPDLFSSEELNSYVSTPQKINLYAYGLNNPVKYRDPTGLEAKGFLTSSEETTLDVIGVMGDVSNFPGGDVVSGVSIANKIAKVTDDPSAETAVELGWEVTKFVATKLSKRIGVALQIADLVFPDKIPSGLMTNPAKYVADQKAIQVAKRQTELMRSISAGVTGINNATEVAGFMGQIGKLDEQRKLQGDIRELQQHIDRDLAEMKQLAETKQDPK
jgi:RHS repeat-associated protein